MAEYIVDTTDGIHSARTTGELVRCKDCERCLTDGEGRYVCALFLCTTTPRDFCSLGEKRED